jgi:two-component system OmpR family sensor kinase/two-component system sensor histidine kinase QseC
MSLAGIATVLAWLTGGLAVLIAVNEESEKLYETRLEDVARVILSFATHEIEEIQQERPGDIVHMETAATLDRRYRYQVWSRDGKLLLVSHDTPRAAFASLNSPGRIYRTIDGVDYWIVSLWTDDHSMQIQVAEREDFRQTVFFSISLYLLTFFIGSVIALALLNRWMFGAATRALDQSADQLLSRSPDDLRPIVADDPPRELKPLLESINRLFQRFHDALDSERHFTAAAAHELRTPLAAVRIQAQVAERARTHKEVREALQQLVVCVDRASRMIEQLLTLAHVESMSASPQALTRMRVDSVATHVVNDMTPLLRSRGIRLSTDLRPAELIGLEFGVAALLRNLLDNAARYCPENGRVRFETGESDGEIYAAVDDSGPGIPDDERERVFQRFYRLEAGVDGCGVGLSIVQCVARAHGGRIALSKSQLGGLRATVFFPPSETDAGRSAAMRAAG